ncbi:MAG: EamA family transporter [Gammaproteobacteria bacterium]|nr:EamA family transporter [Gammaproteobacteria bacterium]
MRVLETTLPTKKANKKQSKTIGYAAAIIVVLIWSIWLVVSRSGAQSNLSIFDLAALRYGISAIGALPFVLYYKPWKSMTWSQIAILSFMLGPVYILFVFGGFTFAPASHGGIFMNGALPAITLVAGWIWFSERIRLPHWIGGTLILIASVLAVLDGAALSLSESWVGDLMFLVGAIFFSGYMILSRLWNISSTQVLLCGSVVNGIIYVPIWWLFLPSGLGEASQNQLILQTLYQGLIPNLLGLLLVSIAVRSIGAATSAAFMAAVPGMGTLLSLIFLGEVPGIPGWLSLLLLTPGILLIALTRKTHPTFSRKTAIAHERGVTHC